MNPSRALQIFAQPGLSYASQVDRLALFLLLACSVLAAGVIGFMLFFLVKYRARPERLYWPKRHSYLPLEISWTLGPLLLSLVFFAWGSEVFLVGSQPPPGALDIILVAKQWMWEFQHADGTREGDLLHVPAGQPIRLLMTSEDVIHSFYVPAFRIKQDVLPLIYTITWFQADEPGLYRINCAEFCGVQHAQMGGQVVVMSPADFAKWSTEQHPARSLAAAGRELFMHYGCMSCHRPRMAHMAPPLEGLYGSTVWLNDGSSLVAEENYLRESIVEPAAKVVSGYRAIMPHYGGKLSEREVLELVAYIKSLAAYPIPLPNEPIH